jgi:hypothetical protein
MTDLVDCIRSVARSMKHGAQRDGRDPHTVLIESPFSRPEPAVWLGFSDVLLSLDRWWLEGQFGCWICGMAAGGKTELSLTWLRAVQQIGFSEPLRLAVLLVFSRDFRSPEWVADHVYRWAREHHPDQKLVLWDGFHELVPGIENQCYQLLDRLLFDGIRVLVTSRNEAPTWLRGHMHQLALASLTEKEATMLLAKAGIPDDARAHIAQQVEGHPLLVKLVSDLARDRRQIPNPEQIGDPGVRRIAERLYGR